MADSPRYYLSYKKKKKTHTHGIHKHSFNSKHIYTVSLVITHTHMPSEYIHKCLHMFIHNAGFKCIVMLSILQTYCVHTQEHIYMYTCINEMPSIYFALTHTQSHTHTQICTNSQAPYTIANTIHNSKQTVISRFQAASQFCSTLLLVCPRLWGGAAAVGFNKSIVFGSCLKGLGFILECCCWSAVSVDVDVGGERAIALGRGSS